MDLLHAETDLTADWLTEALRSSGAITAASVTDFTVMPVGTGQMGDSFRITLTYDRAEDEAPASVVAKFAAQDETSRTTGMILRAYEIELRFYREVASRIDLRVPGCHAAVLGEDGSWFTLLLEDMAPATQGDQIAGLPFEQVHTAAVALAGLHGPCWESAELAGLDWLNRSTPEVSDMTAMMIQGLYPGFVERYGSQLTADELEVCGALIEHLPGYLKTVGGPRTVVHGDFRADNLLFGLPGSPAPLTTVDWQTVTWGRPLSDVAYLVGLSFADPAERAAVEEGLVREYFDALAGYGITDLRWDDCWEQYRHGVFTTLIMAIAPSMLVEQTERGDRMFLTSTRRGCAMARSLDSVALLG